jgi:RNA polymerase sigma-70 factor, ECF subfamily
MIAVSPSGGMDVKYLLQPKKFVHVSLSPMYLNSVNSAPAEIVKQAVQGHTDAFCILANREWPLLIGLARTIIGMNNAEDAVQDALLTAWQKLSTLREPHLFSSWLRRILVNICLRRYAGSATVQSFENHMEPHHRTEPSSAVDIARILSILPPKQRAVLYFTAIEGMKDREIAEVMDIRPGSVRSHRRRARKRLKIFYKEVTHA